MSELKVEYSSTNLFGEDIVVNEDIDYWVYSYIRDDGLEKLSKKLKDLLPFLVSEYLSKNPSMVEEIAVIIGSIGCDHKIIKE